MAWSIAALETCPAVQEIIVVVGASEVERTWQCAVKYGFRKVAGVVIGGEDRQTSVLNGMARVRAEADVILVHDAARPLAPPDVFERCALAATEHGSASAALRVTDTLRQGRLQSIAGETLDRDSLVRIQTPQAVRADIVRSNLSACQAVAALCTDDSSMVEQAAGVPAYLVPGSELSLKITIPEDLRVAEALVRNGAGVRPVDSAAAANPVPDGSVDSSLPFRVGLGYDVHAFDPSRPMMLGGIHIPNSPGLDGHSDADVLLHAVCDAILGAIGEKDIGYHFPNSDPAYSGADSSVLLEQVVQLATESGWLPAHLDVTVIAEQPKLGPHIDAMRARIGSLAKLGGSKVAVKATTNERMGFVGRKEGIACFALATLRRATL